MGIATKVETGCLMVGEFVDEAEVPPGVATHPGEAVLPTTITEFVDYWAVGSETREFTVLLHDGRTIAVRGHGLKHLPATVPGERDSYGIVLRAADREELVAVFKTTDVDGIFHGELKVGGTAA